MEIKNNHGKGNISTKSKTEEKEGKYLVTLVYISVRTSHLVVGVLLDKQRKLQRRNTFQFLSGSKYFCLTKVFKIFFLTNIMYTRKSTQNNIFSWMNYHKITTRTRKRTKPTHQITTPPFPSNHCPISPPQGNHYPDFSW